VLVVVGGAVTVVVLATTAERWTTSAVGTEVGGGSEVVLVGTVGDAVVAGAAAAVDRALEPAWRVCEASFHGGTVTGREADGVGVGSEPRA